MRKRIVPSTKMYICFAVVVDNNANDDLFCSMLQFHKDDERVKLVSAVDDYEEDGDVCDLEISNYSDKSASNGGVVNGYRDDASAAYPSWIASLDEFRYDAFNIKEKSEQPYLIIHLFTNPFI